MEDTHIVVVQIFVAEKVHHIHFIQYGTFGEFTFFFNFSCFRTWVNCLMCVSSCGFTQSEKRCYSRFSEIQITISVWLLHSVLVRNCRYFAIGSWENIGKHHGNKKACILRFLIHQRTKDELRFKHQVH